MAKGKGEIQGWITKNGVHIPIYGSYTVREGHEPTAKGVKWGNKKKRPDTVTRDMKTGQVTGKKYKFDGNVVKGKKSAEEMTGQKLSIKELSNSAADTTYAFIDKDGNEVGRFFESHTNKKANKMELYDKNHAAENGAANKGKQVEGKKPTSFQEQVNDRFKTKKEWDEIAKNAGYKDSSDPEFQKNADDIVAKNKQAAKDEKEAKTIAAIAGLYQAEKQEQESSKATPESYAQSKGKSIRDIAQEVNNNDAARATANQLMKDGRTYEEAAALAHSDMERGTLKGQESSTSKPNKTDAYNDKVFADFKKNGKDYQRVPMEGYAGTANDFRAAAKRAGVEIEYDKDDDTFYLRKSKQDSLSAGTNERSRIRGELHAKDKAMKAAMPTTVSGLRSAYADATGSMKSKIAAELRRKGYSLIGGRWVKGK